MFSSYRALVAGVDFVRLSRPPRCLIDSCSGSGLEFPSIDMNRSHILQVFRVSQMNNVILERLCFPEPHVRVHALPPDQTDVDLRLLRVLRVLELLGYPAACCARATFPARFDDGAELLEVIMEGLLVFCRVVGGEVEREELGGCGESCRWREGFEMDVVYTWRRVAQLDEVVEKCLVSSASLVSSRLTVVGGRLLVFVLPLGEFHMLVNARPVDERGEDVWVLDMETSVYALGPTRLHDRLKHILEFWALCVSLFL